MECNQASMKSKHYSVSMLVSLNRDLGKYGNSNVWGFRKSIYGLAMAYISDWKKPHFRD